MFVALEVMSLPLYLLAGMARRRRLLSQEAALKYFLLGAFSSAFFLYGAAMLYGYSGSVSLVAIADTLSAKPSEGALVAHRHGAAARRPALQGGGRAVPPVDAGRLPGRARRRSPRFMAATVKIAAFGALLRVLYVGLGGMRWDWEPMLWVIAALTMLVGSIIAITQTDIKRMLAYSSIAQAGFILVGVVAASGRGPRSLAVLPGRLRLHDDRRLRHRHDGARRVRRGDAPVEVGGPGQEVARRGGGLLAVHARPSPASR